MKSFRFLVFFIVALSLLQQANAIEAIDYSNYDTNVDYSVTKLWAISEDGFQEYKDENVSFKWKTDTFLPDVFSIMSFGPFAIYATIEMRLKDINGTMFVPVAATFDGMENYEIVEIGEDYYRKVSDKNELLVQMERKTVAFFGNEMYDSPPQGTIKINTWNFNSTTIFLPKNRVLWDFSGSSTSFKLNDHAIFFYNFPLTSTIYYHPTFKWLIHLGLTVFIMLLVFFMIKGATLLPAVKLAPKHLLVPLVLCLLLMVQFGFLVPNPKPIVFEQMLSQWYKGRAVPFYMNFIVGLTDSLDTLVIENFSWCTPNVFSENRNVFLLTKSARQILVFGELKENSECVSLLESNVDKKKLRFIDENKLQDEIQEAEAKTYPWGFLFEITRRIVYGLFLFASFLATAFIFLLAFTTKKIAGFARLALVVIFVPIGLLFNNILVGFLAKAPVTYHGATEMPFIMSTKFLPIFSQAHLIRLAFLMLGIAFVFFFAESVRKSTSIRVFCLPLLIIMLLLTLPPTEFSTKKSVSSMICAECSINYAGPLEVFKTQAIYAALRQNVVVSGLLQFDYLDSLSAIERLRQQGARKEAMNAMEIFLAEYPNAEATPEIQVKLADLYRYYGNYDRAIELYERALGAPSPYPSQYIVFQIAEVAFASGDLSTALKSYKRVLESSEGEPSWLAYTTFKVAQIYEARGDYKNMVFYCNRLMAASPKSDLANICMEKIKSIKESGGQ